MSEMKKTVEKVWAAMSTERLAELDALLDPDCHFQMPGVELRGASAFKQLVGAYAAAFPDLRHEVKSFVEAGDTIALELRVTGTHRGPMQTPRGAVPATGQAITWDSCDYVRFRNGRVVSWHGYYDNTPFLTALGLVRPAA